MTDNNVKPGELTDGGMGREEEEKLWQQKIKSDLISILQESQFPTRGGSSCGDGFIEC